MNTKEIQDKTTELALPLIEELGLIHVDTEYVKEGSEHFLRVFIDKPGGVTIDDCVALTHPMNELLDKHNYIKDAYIFEVSSPGLDRPLKTEADFKRCMGKLLDIKLYAPLEGRKEYQGELVYFDEKCVTILSDTEMVFEREKIASIKQAIIF